RGHPPDARRQVPASARGQRPERIPGHRLGTRHHRLLGRKFSTGSLQFAPGPAATQHGSGRGVKGPATIMDPDSPVSEQHPHKPPQELDDVVFGFAGDSGDGMQLTGTQFTNTSAVFGNDISPLPDYPAEIRAPAGSLPGVSAFQLHFSSHDIRTPGDAP